MFYIFFFFFRAEDGIRDLYVTGVQTCALPISWVGSFEFAQNNRERVGFFPGRTASAPNKYLAAVAVLRDQFRQSLGHQKIEMRLFPEEVGFIRCNDVNQMDNFLRLVTVSGKNVVTVSRIGSHLKFGHASLQATLEHDSLVALKTNAALV